MRTRVNPILCKAKRTCNEICPEVFKLDIWGYAYVAEGFEEVPEGLTPRVLDAAAGCPEGAIVIEED